MQRFKLRKHMADPTRKKVLLISSYIFPNLSAIAATSPAPLPLPSSLRNVLDLQPPEYLRVYFSRSSLRLGCSLYMDPVTAIDASCIFDLCTSTASVMPTNSAPL